MAARRAGRGEDSRPNFIVDSSALIPFFYPDEKPADRHARGVIAELLRRREDRTGDEWLADVCNMNKGSLPPAIYIYTGRLPP